MEDKMFKASVVAMVGLLLFGCSAVDQVSDEDLASGVYLASKGAAKHGLKYAVSQHPDQAESIKTNAILAVDIIKTNVVPVFSGASSGTVLRSAVDTALDLLANRLSGDVVSTIRLALNIVAHRIELPQNPADTLSERARLALVAFFNGVSDGLEDALREMTPAAILPPSDGRNRRTLTWPTNR